MIKVLIVDDSALIRNLLSEILSADPELEVVGTAQDPYVAREKIKALQPDVITLDIEMPRMDGLTFLSNIMRLRPMPVVMISTLTQIGAQASLDALQIGAVDYIGKPRSDLSTNLEAYATQIVETVKTAAQANTAALSQNSCTDALRRRQSIRDDVADEVLPRSALQRLVAIGASTGGTEAIAEVIAGMPASSPPVVIAQHIPGMFSKSFSERVNSLSAMQVGEAADGEPVLAGHAYVAPGNHHLRVYREGASFYCGLDQSEPVNRHRPSVEVLFASVARAVGPKAIGVLLTGMGSDGALGMKMMKEAGAKTIAQDRETSVVWGMPGSAVELGVVDKVVGLGGIAREIIQCAKSS